jgi:NAD(P)-dependent dehydrogenase (short-subunit alcohol dehydrogenase family)
MKLAGKVLVVTGAGSGIARAVTLEAVRRVRGSSRSTSVRRRWRRPQPLPRPTARFRPTS